MEMQYYSTYDADVERFQFWVKLTGRIEVLTAGTTVYMFLGFYDEDAKAWDYLRCAVDYDGQVNANANSRLFTVSDHYSVNKPWTGVNGALESNIPKDEVQNWYIRDNESKTECPPLQRCIFTCAAKRDFDTGDTEDYNFFEGTTQIITSYAVYYGDNELTTGMSQWKGFIIPFGGAAGLSTTLTVMAAAMSSYLLF